MAAEKGHLNCLRYAYHHGCPATDKDEKLAIKLIYCYCLHRK